MRHKLAEQSGNDKRVADHETDIKHLKAILAAKIVDILDDDGVSVRKAARQSGLDEADLSKIRHVALERFTIDRLIKMVNRLGCRVDVEVSICQQPESAVIAEAMGAPAVHIGSSHR